MAYKKLGDGLLATLTGTTRQAIHKARKASYAKAKATFDRALRRKLDLRFPSNGDNNALIKAAMGSYLRAAKDTLSEDLRKTHKITDTDAAADELSTLLDVPYKHGQSLFDVLFSYCKKIALFLASFLKDNTDLAQWPWGKPSTTPKQRNALRLRWQRNGIYLPELELPAFSIF